MSYVFKSKSTGHEKPASKTLSFFKSRSSKQANPLEWYLNLTKKCMVRAQKMASPSVSPSPKFNHGQCMYLSQKLNLAIQSAQCILEVLSSFHPRGDMAKYLESFKLLYALAIEVENFIRSCCKDVRTQATVLLTNVSEYISSIGFDLELWTAIESNEIKTLDEVNSVFQAEVDVVIEQASRDKEILLKKLHALLRTRKVTSIEYQQAALLLERFEKSRLNPIGDSPRSSQFGLCDAFFKDVEQMESLGKGSAATVYRAMWLGAEVAKKTFYGPKFPDFEQEVSILLGLSHPNITSLLSYAKDKRECSIFMELMDGDLFHLIQRRLRGNGGLTRDFPFSILEAVSIMLQISTGMLYLHQMSIVHRDLKSMNILVKCGKAFELDTEYVQVKVADFGMSRTKEKSMTYSNQSTNIGTTRWMAPEMIKISSLQNSAKMPDGEAAVVHYPFKSDIYSFAMVCYELLSGQTPFSNISSAGDVKKMVLDGERPTLPQCPPLMKNLIERCWSPDASQRPSFDDICAELRQLKCYLLLPYPLNKPMQPLDYAKGIPDSTLIASSSSSSSSPKKRGIWLAGLDFGITRSGSTSKGVSNKMKLTPEQVSGATLNFSQRKKIGQGIRSTVYRGVTIPSNTSVAVKKFSGFVHHFEEKLLSDGFETLCHVRHWWLVKVLGYSCIRGVITLVTEYMPNGTLRDLMHPKQDTEFSWTRRFKIARDVAEGLQYLHFECLPPSVHGNLTPSNILFNAFMETRVADFGVAQLSANYVHGVDFHNHVHGVSYKAPESANGVVCSRKSDVYSFGLIVLEMVSGRSPQLLEAGQSLPQWIRQTMSDSKALQNILDPKLMSGLRDDNEQTMAMVVGVALLCTREDPAERPFINEVLKMLNHIKDRAPDNSPRRLS